MDCFQLASALSCVEVPLCLKIYQPFVLVIINVFGFIINVISSPVGIL